MLLNDRDRYSKYHEQGYLLNWHKWKESIHSLACRCAERALQKGYNYFGLQFYGECWSGPFAEFNYSRAGVSDRCIMNHDDGQPTTVNLKKPTACVQAQDQECVGQQLTNYIYKLASNSGPQSPDVDGGYSQWSQWSKCSKSCGIGRKSRERTCTNPRPQGNGKSCRRLGWPDESMICFQECNNCDKVMDVGIDIDSSSSVRRKNYEKVKAFLIQLVDKMHISHRMTHVAVIHYNHRAYLDWDFNSDRAKNAVALKKAILNLKYQPGGTRTDIAMDKSMEEMFKVDHGQRPDVPHVLFVLTDGKTSSRSKPYEKVLKAYKDRGVKVVAIGVGPSVDNKELTEIAMGQPDNVVHVQQFDQLVSKLDEIVQKSCAAMKSKLKYY
ncbi:collagen alpha-1(XIV) chain-like [Porites lutea]|uniref:collagen alpha-1(XIV) chain-like n=1 Tax=Porites lutea TaxID=51062 RepID=UPI003CC6602F